MLFVLGLSLLLSNQAFANLVTRGYTYVNVPLKDCLKAAEKGVLQRDSVNGLNEFEAIHDGKFYVFMILSNDFYCGVMTEQ